MATGLSTCLLRDGTGTPTANIGWGGYRITGLADPVNPQDAATRNYVMITMVGIYLPVAGGTLTGALSVGGAVTVTTGGLTVTGGITASTGAITAGTGGALASLTAAGDVVASQTGGTSGIVRFGTGGAAFISYDGVNFNLNGGSLLRLGLELGYKDVPQNPQAAAYTLALTDRSEHIYYTGAAVVLTIPANATVAFPIGAATTIVNDGTGALSLTRAAGVTMKLVGTGANLDRSLAVAGIATLLKVGTNTWFLSGTGIT